MITLTQIQSKLAEAIRQSGMTQTELGRQLNIRQQTVSHYIKGDIMPALDTFANLCIVLDVDPADILCTNAPNPNSRVNIHGNNGNIHIGHNYNISGNNNRIK